MGRFFENIDMKFVDDMTEEEFNGLTAYALNECSHVSGYYGLPYFRCDFGDAQFFFHTGAADDGNLELTTLDTHVAGNCTWRLRKSKIEPAGESLLPTEKRCIFSNAENGQGLIVVNVLNADVLPSFMEDDEYVFQMVAFAYGVDYFKDDEEYDKILPTDENGDKIGLGEGAVFPVGFMSNHQVKQDGSINEIDEEYENATAIKGTIKTFYRGKVKMGDDLIGEFVRCIVDTCFGEIEIVHKYEQVKEEQRGNLVAGAIICATVYLSGDAAIYEYENGIVKNEENHLKLLRYSMTSGDAKRLESVLSEDVKYISKSLEEPKCGRDAIINYIDYVKDRRKDEIIINLAKIKDSDDNEDQSLIGKRCLLIGYEGEQYYDATLMIDLDEDSNIKRIIVNSLIGYSFEIDSPSMQEEKVCLKEVGLLKYAVFEEWTYDPPGGSARFCYDSVSIFNKALLNPVEEILEHISMTIDEGELEEASTIMEMDSPSSEDIRNWSWDNGGVGCGCVLYAEGDEIAEKVIEFYHDELAEYVEDKFYYDEDGDENTDNESKEKLSEIEGLLEQARLNPHDYDSVMALINLVSNTIKDRNESYFC